MKKVIIHSLLVGWLLGACTFLPAPTPRTPFPTLMPFNPPTSSPPTLTPTATSLPPSPTSQPVIFRDDFSGQLAAGWEWRGEDPKNIRLDVERGALELTVAPGYAFEEGLASLLLRAAPVGDFQIETQVTLRPFDEAQFAGLIIYESRNAYLQTGRGYCRVAADCVRNGIYFDRFMNGRLQSGGVHLSYEQTNTVGLRLERRGPVYTFYVSANNVVWQPIGQRESSLKPLYVGLFAGQNTQALALPAYFDYFEISGPK
jgi:beta-xylosidase